MSFEGLHVVVTGGTGGLGSAVVRHLLGVGAVCHIPCFDADELDRFPDRDHPNVRATSGVDLTDEAAVARFYETVPDLWASVNLVGGFAMTPLAETGQGEFMKMINLNTVTCFLSCREAVKSIRARPETSVPPPGGRIVNVSARPGLEPRTGKGMAAYTASKAAVAALTQALAQELAPEGIWVNAIAPSVIDTEANRKAMPKANHDNWPKPAEIAQTIVFLASTDNTLTRGSIVTVYGKS